MSEAGQPCAALWPTLPPERRRTVLLMFAKIVLRQVRAAPQGKEVSDEHCSDAAIAQRRAGEDPAPTSRTCGDGLPSSVHATAGRAAPGVDPAAIRPCRPSLSVRL